MPKSQANEQLRCWLSLFTLAPEFKGSAGYKGLPQLLSQIAAKLSNRLDVPTDCAERKEQLLDSAQSPFALNQLPELLGETDHLVAALRPSGQKDFEGFLITRHQRIW